MGYASEIKIMFLIFNTTSCVVPGLLFFSYGVGAEIFIGKRTDTPKALIVVGLVLVALAALGYCGAITQNRRKLKVYGTVMLLPLAMEVAGLTVTCGANPAADDQAALQLRINDCMMIISHMVAMLVSVGLSTTVALQAPAAPATPTEAQAQATAPAPFVKYICYS